MIGPRNNTDPLGNDMHNPIYSRISKAIVVCTSFLAICLPIVSVAQNAVPIRPRITGVSHVGYFVSDLPKAITFWHDLLGFDVAYNLKTAGDKPEVAIAFIKINDRQHVELFTAPPAVPQYMLSHICLTVDDIEQMRSYLKANGFTVPASDGHKTRAGDYAFTIKDPEGITIEFVQSLPDGMEALAAGKFMPESRISSRIYHMGFLVGNSQREMDFYGRVLGFKETWRGGPDPKQLSWINMRVPDGDDYVEFMLYEKLPDPSHWGSENHICLEVSDVAQAVAILQRRPAFSSYGRPLDAHTGKNGKRQVNLFDPDGTRVELMEPQTVDGKPVLSSTAPPPGGN